jgi:hypothetical protein
MSDSEWTADGWRRGWKRVTKDIHDLVPGDRVLLRGGDPWEVVSIDLGSRVMPRRAPSLELRNPALGDPQHNHHSAVAYSEIVCLERKQRRPYPRRRTVT